MCMPTDTLTCTHTLIHTLTQTCTHKHMSMRTHTHRHTLTHVFTCINGHTYTFTYTHMLSHTHAPHMQVNTYPLSHTSPNTCMYTHTHTVTCAHVHTHHTEVRPPTHLSVVSPAILASWFSRGGVCDRPGPGRRGSTLMVPRGTGVEGGLCPGTACPNIRWCPQRVPATWAGPSPRPLQAGAAWTTALQSPRSARHLSSGPPVGGRPVIGLCSQAVRGTQGWGRHSRWQKRKHGFSLTSLNGRRAGLCRAGRGWISHLDRTRSQGSLPHFFLEECWKFWWPGMEKENLRTLKSFTASGVEAFTQARW